jgi:serine/threonine-protein kinase
MADFARGHRLGPYETLETIGAGGMGVVWKARDTRLGRLVAIKISKDAFSERFDREARAVAALNHPHICQLYDIGPNYLVMEFVDGSPLRGPLPMSQAVEYAGQILEALDAAHRKGITHRDLKPANILVTKQGIKLLDFGLAKQKTPLKQDVDTLTRALTSEGTIIGTLQYMSPEQLQGRETDARSDLFAFGCVLYEMLTGKRAFASENTASVIASILEREPEPLTAAPPLERVVRRALAKDPDQRFQTARDLKAALTWAMEHAPTPAPRATRSRALWWLTAALATIASVASWMAWRVTPAREQPVVRLDVDLGSEASVWNVGPSAILSPDATRIVFVAQAPDGRSRLSTRRLDEPRSTELPGTDGAYGPFFSPDGQWVGFFAAAKLKKTRLDGGEPVVLCDANSGRGATWGEDGTIIATLSNRGGLSRVPAEGGQPTLFARVNAESLEQGYRWPQLLPDGKSVLCNLNNIGANFGASPIVIVSVTANQRKVLPNIAGMYPRYLSTGHIVFVKQGTMFAAPFNLEHLEVKGPAAPVLERISADTAFGSAQVDFSSNGAMLYRRGRTDGIFSMEWLDISGKTQSILTEPASFRSPRLSPDGKQIAATLTDGITSAIWSYDLDRGSRIKLTPGSPADAFPLWSPDGHYLVFRSEAGLHWIRADGGRQPQILLKARTVLRPCSFTPDGKWLVYDELKPGGGALVRVVAVKVADGEPRVGQPETFLDAKSDNPLPAFSADGKWLAYADTESGRYEVYVRSFPDKGAKWQVSNGSGIMPVWSPKRHEIFYRTLEDHRIMVVEYSVNGDIFVPGKPRVWTTTQLGNTGQTTNFGIAPDGLRFVVLMSVQGQAQETEMRHVTLVLNFFDELRRRVSTVK